MTPPDDSNPARDDYCAELYDSVPLYLHRADVSFYVEEALAAERCKPPDATAVLELGCGSGRVLLSVARAGASIVGLDRSASMLARCRAKLSAEPPEVQRRARLLAGDMRRFDLPQKFALVTTPFRSFQHLLRVEEQLACLECVRRHLLPGGRLILDVFHVNPAALSDPVWLREQEDTPETPLPDGRTLRRTHRVLAFHRAEQYNEIELCYYLRQPDGRTEIHREQFALRYFFRYELEHLLARCGFRVTALYGDYDRRPFRDDSPEMITVAEKV